jgi:hypothetical protein
MSLSVNVMTRGPGDRVAAMLALLRPAADEILVALDDRAGPEVEAALAGVADRIIRYPYEEPVDRPLAWIHAQCTGDWVLTIDDDEVPGRALVDALPELTRRRDVTHFWFPRRWLYPGLDRWLDARPWRPDYQARLVRNDPAALVFPDETHVPIAPLGPSRYLELPIYHADCVLNSLEAREAKARRYEQLHPGKRVAGRPLNEAYYLPERVDPPTREVPAEDFELIAEVFAARPPVVTRADVRSADRAEIDAHWAGRELDYAGALTLLEDVPPMRAGGYTTVDVRVENLGGSVWPWGGETVAVGTRWLLGETAQDGEHTPLPSDLPPDDSQVVPVAVSAPVEPGSYVLEIDLVHQNVRWFGHAVGTRVEVLPRRVVAILDPGSPGALSDVLETLDPEEEPVVVSGPEGLAGAVRLLIPAELVRTAERRPLIALVREAGRLKIPVLSSSGKELTARDVARRRL